MLIFYGVRSRTQKSKLFGGFSTCPNCQTSKFIRVRVYNYAHIFWIPLFPFNINNVFVCTECGKTIDKSNADPQLINDAKAAKVTAGVPLAGFVIPIIIAAIMLISTVNQAVRSTSFMQNRIMESKNYLEIDNDFKKARFSNPKVGDILTYIDEEDEYHNADYPLNIIKLVDISEGEYTFAFSQFSFTDVNTMYDSIEDQTDNFWYEDGETITKELYESLLETGYFIDIFKKNR